MTPQQLAQKIIDWFSSGFVPKFVKGQIEHTGVLTDMGAYQALNAAKEENHDTTAYLYTLENCLNQIKELCESSVEVDSKDILEILERVKND